MNAAQESGHDSGHEPAQDPGQCPDDGGYTLVELLVAIGLLGVVSTLLLGLALSTAEVTDEIQSTADVTQESRLAVERLSRELRQTAAVDKVELTSLGDATTSLTVWTDFDGDGLRDTGISDPEVLTYRWDPTAGRLTLTANDADGAAITRPVLAEVVSRFDLRLLSSAFEPDADGDGRTTWQELDAYPALGGNGNGRPDGAELAHLDLVEVSMTVRDGDVSRDFTLRVDLRNQEGGAG
ncbi:PilW family protein [Nocardioides bruguierae]|uniref:PilW family protein n=1 Tax=Nocardioides bruguierae TaxID=2945102 RepID=UPI00202221FE|nr:prepilin-type N-terminal cleavage/methylation domain-containing protein [Nocardioides bruguierae]MCL8027635.1 prepilin-type N-terminal cleavage/methylation domain-containing protein [Nocardioides bruguierae]